MINFPEDPNIDDTYTANGRTWKWSGSRWQTVNASAGDVSVVTDFNDLVNRPVLGTAAATDAADYAPANHNHSYNTLANKPILGTAAASNATDFATAAQGAKADSALQSGAAISTISGLQTALDEKAATSHTHPLSQITQSSATNGQVATWNGTAWVPQTPASSNFNLTSYLASINQSSTIIETVERNVTFTNSGLNNSVLYLSMLTPIVDTTITRLSANIVNAAVGTTFFKMGIYSYNEATNTATLLASTSNVPSAVTSVQIAELLLTSPASITLNAGTRYAFALLAAGSTTNPSVSGISIPFSINQLAPLLVKTQGGQSDLPATVQPSGGISGIKFWIRGS